MVFSNFDTLFSSKFDSNNILLFLSLTYITYNQKKRLVQAGFREIRLWKSFQSPMF